MNTVQRKLRNLKYCDLFIVFDRHDEKGLGRCCMLGSAILSAIITDLISGSLYTAFLTVNNFTIVDAGVLTFLPLIASCFTIFSPMILERFPHRKWILAGGRAAYYTINIVGLTVLPRLVQSAQAKLIFFGAVVFLASLVNNLFASGYSVWHLNFIPYSVRARYMSYQQTITAIISGLVLCGSGFAADALRGSPHEAAVLTALRLAGYGLALLEIVILLLPHEYEYPHAENRIRLSAIFRLPLHNRKFMRTMGIIAFWTFFSNLPASSWTYYLLNSVHTGVTLINFITLLYGLVLVVLTPFWQRVLKKSSWFRTFAYAAFLNVPTLFACAFVTQANYLWLYSLIRIGQHMLGVGLNLAWANFPYINMPRQDQTCYMSFYLLVANLIAFAGQLCGTSFVRWMNGAAVTVFGMEMGAVQLLLLMQGVLTLVCAILILHLLPKLTPDPAAQE